MKSDIHVRVTGGKPLKKIILTSAKTVAEELQGLSTLKRIREDKRKKTEKIEKLLGEIRGAFDELKIKDVSYKGAVEKETEKKEIKPQLIVPKIDRQELQLARELEEIEKKLASL